MVWDMPTDRRELFLTFDDGPIPGVTERALDLLKAHGAKATFFCVGQNVARHPEIFERIRREGHAVGNHTHRHLDGWRTPRITYLRDYIEAQELIGSSLFRPPYGRLRPELAAAISRKSTVVMWGVLSGDFDVRRSARDCTRNCLQHAQPGSVVVFHDSVKAESRMLPTLEACLRSWTTAEYRFSAIQQRP